MLAIGTLAKRTGTKVQTIRYYEQIGLMPEPDRTEGGQRRYGITQLDRLAFIRHSRQLGFSLEAIRELLACQTRPNVLALRSMLSPKGSSAKSRQGLCGSRHSALNCSG